MQKPIHREPSTDDEGTPSSESEAHERAPPHQRRRDVAPAQRDDAQLELIRRKEQELQAALEKQRAELAAMQKQRAQEEEKVRTRPGDGPIELSCFPCRKEHQLKLNGMEDLPTRTLYIGHREETGPTQISVNCVFVVTRG